MNEQSEHTGIAEDPADETRTLHVDVPRGTVVLAATPIGNTADASARLVALLERADIVAAEDTRRLYALANRLSVHVGLPVTCAPGPSAVLDALALSGLPTDRFCYEGFLPRKHSERMQALRALKGERRTIVFYETLHRIAESMADLEEVFGPDRRMALCRELTKDYEQIRRGTIHEINESVANDPPRGEMVLVIAGASEDEADPAQSLSVEELAELAMQYAQAHGMRIKDAIAEVIGKHPNADGTLANRKQVYNAVLALRD